MSRIAISAGRYASVVGTKRAFGCVLAVVVVGSAAAASGSAVPVLGAKFGTGQKGFGQVHPRSLYAGGDPTSIVNHIHWKSWGKTLAIGTAQAFYVPPRGPVAAGYMQPARIVASRLGTCRGRYAYRRVQWYFPTHGQHYKKLGNYGFNAAEMCG